MSLCKAYTKLQPIIYFWWEKADVFIVPTPNICIC